MHSHGQGSVGSAAQGSNCWEQPPSPPRGNRGSGHGVGALSLGRGPPQLHSGPGDHRGWAPCRALPCHWVEGTSALHRPREPQQPTCALASPETFPVPRPLALQSFTQQMCHRCSWPPPPGAAPVWSATASTPCTNIRHPAGPGSERRSGRGALTRGYPGFSGRGGSPPGTRELPAPPPHPRAPLGLRGSPVAPPLQGEEQGLLRFVFKAGTHTPSPTTLHLGMANARPGVPGDSRWQESFQELEGAAEQLAPPPPVPRSGDRGGPAELLISGHLVALGMKAEAGSSSGELCRRQTPLLAATLHLPTQWSWGLGRPPCPLAGRMPAAALLTGGLAGFARVQQESCQPS